MVDMKYRILTNKLLTKKELRRRIFKWLLYIFCLLFFYMIMRSGAFSAWQPFFIIPLAVAVSMRERELSSCVFALFCGFFIDISCRFIFGFSAIWLMTICIVSSLLSKNLIRVNILNFLWINIVAVILEFSMDYLFNIFLWNIPGGDMVFNIITIPSVVSTVIISPFVYLLVRLIDKKFSYYDKFNYYLPENSAEDDELKSKD